MLGALPLWSSVTSDTERAYVSSCQPIYRDFLGTVKCNVDANIFGHAIKYSIKSSDILLESYVYTTPTDWNMSKTNTH